MNSQGDFGHEAGHILIVEDSPTQALQLQYILEQRDYRVSMVTNGQEALAVMRQRKPLMVISDIVMPHMDGYQLCRQIRANASFADIPVVLLTSLSDPKDVIMGLECGADNFIVKPYDEALLLSRIQYILANRRLRGAESTQMGLEIIFAGQKYFITSDRLQILNLLLSTYEAAVQKNLQLSQARDALQAEIAERKRIEETLRATNAELEAFSYSISHDLRSPLRTIQSFAQILLEDYAEALDAEGQDHAQRIVTAAQHLASLTEDLLAYSRIGRAEMSLTPVSLEQVVDEVLTHLERDIQGQEAQIIIDRPLPRVLGHHATLVQIIANLLTNAIKFVTPGVPPQVRLWGEKHTPWECLWVKDNGIGIAPEYQEGIFRVFERLHGAETYPGTGIGLAIVCKGAARMGGRVGVESTPGQGSAFWVELPSAP
jgi:two-component system, sensor histidine kinase and response regulator